MRYFIACKGHSGWKARNRMLYPTEQALKALQRNWPDLAHRYRIHDADHEPGRSILVARHGFS